MGEAIAGGADGPLAGLCQYMNNPGQPAPAQCALRLFDQQYAVNISIPSVEQEVPSAAPVDKIVFSDMIAGSSTAVYRIGCVVPQLPEHAYSNDSGTANLVYDGAFT